MKASQPQQSRRRLFAGAGTVAAVAAVASVLPVRQEPTPVAQPEAQPDQRSGYRLTEHVQRYYQTARV
ncbi:formate dehydrogenase [Caldimonas caldifontis]|uniref:Formate dehydrogenase n=1 Tax=Caldimonas caldifontis TaxID=1452508 RepID=A0A2S5SRA8_9BURK|nr:formate dehydrogenase [Caldimonas caldifontis]PPE65224.1 formate dehydrogenase [Caldimonas caldifontis]